MAKTLHAVDYLAQPGKYLAQPVCVVFGGDAFLRRQSLLKLREAVLGGEEADFSLSVFDGGEAQFRDVLGELGTVAMFGGRRLVVVEEAEDFISGNRAELEDYVARPARTGILALETATWPSNTRLYKAVAADGLAIDCNVPAAAQLARWLGGWAKQAHGVELPLAAAELIVETIGPELGLIDQELAKLAPMAGSSRTITPEMVGRMVGGWRAKTTWEMLDAALDGKPAAAMVELDRLLASGENAIGLLARFPPRSAASPPPRGWSSRPRRPGGASRSVRPWSRPASAPSPCQGPSGSFAASAASGGGSSTAGSSRPIST